MGKTVILDTNFLLIPCQFRVDIFSEIARICNFSVKIAVLDRTVDELERIRKTQKGRNRLAASFALALLKKKDLKIIRTNSKKPVDDLIADYAKRGAIIATQDAELRKIIKKNRGKIIFLRNKRFLKLG
jgi:hypothetical protein